MIKRITRFFILVLFATLTAQNVSGQGQNCSCWVDRDTSFHVVPMITGTPPLYRNDDGYSAAIVLPFHICFYGSYEDSVAINNNGNISFKKHYATYTADSFPLVNFSMVAPFWADVDTRNPGSGVVWYKIRPNYMIVQWDSVGYYGSHVDKLNTFQCIISNGNDPIIPYGNNVEFCYKSMQWTTGDASGGAAGFGCPPANGSPATVGANKGDGINFVQVGLFNSPGNTYIGQYPPPPYYDDVSWLSNQSFLFNTCSGSVPPLVTGVSPCDTFIVCTGDTTDVHISFLSPVQTDSSFGHLVVPAPPGVTVLSNTPGITDNMVLQIIGSGLNYGNNVVNLYGWTNAVPHDTVFVTFVLQVDSSASGFVTASKDTICPGDSVKLIAHTNVHNYNWSNGATTDSTWVKPNVTTTYTLNVSKGKCALSLAKTIVVSSGGFITINHDSVCPGDSTTLTIIDGSSYKWNTGATTSSITVVLDSSQTFSCISHSPCGSDTLKKRAYLLPKPIPGITGPDTACIGSQVTLTASGGSKYSWSNGATTSSITITLGGTTTYTVGISNGACVVDTSKTVTAAPAIVGTITIHPKDTICAGDSATLIAGGGGSYMWLNNSKTTDSIRVSPPPGVTTYSLTVNKGGCSATVTQQLIVVNGTAPTLTLTKDSICSNDSTTITVNGQVGDKYKWLAPIAPGVSGNATVTLKGSNGTITYKVIVSSPCLIDTLTKTLHVSALPNITQTGNTTICFGKNTTLLASGGTTYSWAPPIGLSCTNCPNPTASPTTNINYTLTVSNGKCKSDTVIPFTVNQLPQIIMAANPANICYGTPSILTATGGGTYLWSNGATTSAVTVTPGQNTTYSVVVNNGCIDSNRIGIVVDSPYFQACCDSCIIKGSTVDIGAYGVGMNYAWIPSATLSCDNCPFPQATPTVTTTYTVTSVDAKGCRTVRTVTICLDCLDFTVPNVFTPNDDGINDDFEVKLNNYTTYSIQIFDRWGKEVYKSTDPTVYWTGRIMATTDMVPDGTYFYEISATCDANTYKKKGFVQVITGGAK